VASLVTSFLATSSSGTSDVASFSSKVDTARVSTILVRIKRFLALIDESR